MRLLEFRKTQSNGSAALQYLEIDIMAPGQQKWKDAYDFDVPVLHIDHHADNGAKNEFQPSLDAARKLMHRFTVEELGRAVREVEEEKPSP